MPVLSGPVSENLMCRDVNRDIARSKRDISMMSRRLHHDPGWGFGSNVMFRPPLGTLTSFIAKFQLTDVLHWGGIWLPPWEISWIRAHRR